MATTSYNGTTLKKIFYNDTLVYQATDSGYKDYSDRSFTHQFQGTGKLIIEADSYFHGGFKMFFGSGSRGSGVYFQSDKSVRIYDKKTDVYSGGTMTLGSTIDRIEITWDPITTTIGGAGMSSGATAGSSPKLEVEGNQDGLRLYWELDN